MAGFIDPAAAFPGIHLEVLPSRAAVFAAVKKDPENLSRCQRFGLRDQEALIADP